MKTKTLITLCVFCIAMAVLESAVVVYLRALCYPHGFTVAFKVTDQSILLVEIAREAATIIMLLSVALLAGRNIKEQSAYFLIGFAVWDLFYYVWLKVFINWPLSLFDWDILFLIPITWLGPILAPVICSLTMIVFAVILSKRKSPINVGGWALLIIGISLILYTFMIDYGTILLENNFYGDFSNLLENKKFIDIAGNYVPRSYNWFLFSIGELLLLIAIAYAPAKLKSITSGSSQKIAVLNRRG